MEKANLIQATALAAAFVLLLDVGAATAQIASAGDVVSAGATRSSGGVFSLVGTVGQQAQGVATSDQRTILTGFWRASGGIFPMPIVADLRLLLEGAHIGDGVMRTSAARFVPKSQPYADPSFTSTPMFYDGVEEVDSIDVNVVDWVVVELRSDSTVASTVARRAGLLLHDGLVVDLDGASPLAFEGVDSGDYFVVVRHVNHIPAMSAQALAFSRTAATTFDFSSDAGDVYGAGSMKEIEPGVFALFAGDANQDGQVNDVDLTAYLIATNDGATGYLKTDFTRDGQVTSPDFNVYLANGTAAVVSAVPDGAGKTGGDIVTRTDNRLNDRKLQDVRNGKEQ